jgi:hypothetical protein
VRVAHDLLLIEWNDSARTEGWHFLEGVPDRTHPCMSVGWLYRKTADNVTIFPHCAANKDGDFDQFLGTLCIPRHAIKRIVTLRKAGNF